MFHKFLNSLKTPNNASLIEAIQKGYNTIFEERRHYNKQFAEDESPIKEDDVLTVYHGFNNINDALTVAQFGLSGKGRARRIYSYESGNNPKGLFVTIDPNVIKRGGFAHSGVIIEFATKVKDLDTPVWAGGGSYFVQGQMTQSFKDDDDRKKQQLAHREEQKKSDVKSISDSDRPELAYTLFRNAEKQALYIGDLNPNMIRAFWVNERLMHDRMLDGNWERIKPKEFIKKYTTKENTDNAEKYSDSYRESKQRLFAPNDNYDETKLSQVLKNQKYELDLDYVIDLLKKDEHVLYSTLWPKQIEQFKEKYGMDE